MGYFGAVYGILIMTRKCIYDYVMIRGELGVVHCLSKRCLGKTLVLKN
jgi:hypothetical protein